MILTVCSHCRSQKVRECNRERVSNRLRNALPSDIGFQEVRCLAACDRPIAVGISANAKTSYLFGDIKNEEDVCGAQGLLNFLKSHPAMAETEAVKNEAFVSLKYAELTPGPANIGAIQKIAKAMSPERF